MKVPVYKVASPELMDFQLLERIALTKKPILMSTGMATLAEIDEAMSCIRDSNNKAQIALLKCTADYPALPEEINLLTIPHMNETFGVPVGISDHTLGTEVANASVALGACVVEKHIALSRGEPGPDVAFSMEPGEFKKLVREIRNVEKACGSIYYGPTQRENINKKYRRSLFVAEDIQRGESFNTTNVRSVRPGQGLHTKHLVEILGCTARRDLQKGTPLDWSMVS